MEEFIANSPDFYDTNLEKNNLFCKIFSELNIYLRTKLHNFCFKDKDFTDLTDYIFSCGTCTIMDTFLSQIVSNFIDNIKISESFSEKEKENLIHTINIFFSKKYISLKSHQQNVLEEIIVVMNINSKTKH